MNALLDCQRHFGPILDIASVDEKCLMSSPHEVVHAIRKLESDNEVIAVRYGSGYTGTLMSAVLDVSKEHRKVYIDCSNNEEANFEVMNSNNLVIQARPLNVGIQFSTGKPSRVPFGNGFAFSVDIPDQMIRLQRREYYRVAMPYFDAQQCHLLNGKYSGELGNISLGGISVLLNVTDAGVLSEEARIEQCWVDLPSIGRIAFDLLPRNKQLVKRINQTLVQLGCEFSGLGSSDKAALQRYIMRLEREQIPR